MRSYMVALGLLFIALGHPSFAQTEASAPAATEPTSDVASDTEYAEIVMFDVRGYFSLNCTPPGGVSANYSWKKNGSLVETLADLKDRYKLEEKGAVFRLSARATEDDYGNYTCLVDGAAALEWRVHARPTARLPHNSNVVEGQKLKLTCKLIGKPYVPVTWTFGEEGGNASDVGVALHGRARLGPSAAGVPGAELVLEAAERSDAGVYTCVPEGGAPFSTVLRVKDMYAALWPFLGICAEVLILCAIILVYEKRRTKPELDDSDTDNHEQKKS